MSPSQTIWIQELFLQPLWLFITYRTVLYAEQMVNIYGLTACEGYSCLGFALSFRTKFDGLSCSFSYSLKSLLLYFPHVYKRNSKKNHLINQEKNYLIKGIIYKSYFRSGILWGGRKKDWEQKNYGNSLSTLF